MRIAFDIGGTFTDVLALGDDHRLATAKVLSLIDRVGDDIVETLHRLSPGGKVDRFVHGTTICSNAVIENKVAVTGLLTTKGFRDVLPLRDQRGPSSPTVNWQAPDPLIPRPLCLEVDERIRADGQVDRMMDEAGARAQIRKLVDGGVEAIAVCLINSYLNPVHEKRLGELIEEEAPGLMYCLSADVNPEVREYPRTSTTVINTSLRPVVTRYLDTLEAKLSPHGSDLLIMQSNGGIMTSDVMRRRPMFMVESGPAAGALAAARFAAEAGLKNVLSFDMGGTTAKACLIRDGIPLEKSRVSVGAATTAGGWSQDLGHVVRVPSIDLVEVGAGGGSIAWIEGGVLRVGPHSAGADPGPVCYARGGTRPTVTDANVVLGNISPQVIGNGKLRIDRAAALEAYEKLGKELGIDALQAAFGVTQVANAVMMRALRAVSIERGFDPRDFVLMAFGGAGPIHAAALAESIGIDKVVIPAYPGLFSALGLLLADFRVDHIAAMAKPLDAIDGKTILARFVGLETAAREELDRTGVKSANVRFERKVDVRYAHQLDEMSLNLPEGANLPQAIKQLYVDTHKREFGFEGTGQAMLINLRLRAIVPSDPVELSSLQEVGAAQSDRKEGDTRDIYFGPQRGMLKAKVLTRAMITGVRQGPAVIEDPDTTIVIPPGWSVKREGPLNLIISKD